MSKEEEMQAFYKDLKELCDKMDYDILPDMDAVLNDGRLACITTEEIGLYQVIDMHIKNMIQPLQALSKELDKRIKW